jgi:hypothetical protein
MSKLGKIVRKDGFKNYNIFYGTVNNKVVKALYINISAWVEISEEFDYSRSIRLLNKEVKQKIYNLLSSEKQTIFNEDRTIVDLDIKKSGIKLGKRSFMNCEITLFNNHGTDINSIEIKEMLDNISSHLIKHVFENNNRFKFHKKKTS